MTAPMPETMNPREKVRKAIIDVMKPHDADVTLGRVDLAAAPKVEPVSDPHRLDVEEQFELAQRLAANCGYKLVSDAQSAEYEPAQPEAPKVEQEPELKADFTRAHPSGMDDCTYSEIEDALDRKDAPVFGKLGLPLTLAQRVDALTPPAPASNELLEAIDMDDFNVVGEWIEGGEKGGAPSGRVKGLWQSMRRVISIAKHKGPQS